MKRIILCADDYGQSSAISQAIIELIKYKRLTATSCMTTMPEWLSHAVELKPFINQIDIGLHFNLTEGLTLSKEMADEGFMLLPKLLMKAYLQRLNKDAIRAELCAQLDRFVLGLGRLPDYIDGHQHVHQFPMIRDVVLAVYEERLKQNGAYLRSVHDSKAFLRVTKKAYLKRIIIQLCGATSFKNQLLRRHIPHNSSFSGIYDFSDSKNYERMFRQFLQDIGDNGVIMCHPGLLDPNNSDVIARSRFDEYQYFQSEAFEQACKYYKISLARLRSQL